MTRIPLTGTHSGLLEASTLELKVEKRQGRKISTPEESGWSADGERRRAAAALAKTGYSHRLSGLLHVHPRQY